MMIFINEIEKFDKIGKEDYKKFLQLLSPFAPHITEELWSSVGEKQSINKSNWPKWDKNKIVEVEIKMAIQINGKVRAEIRISKGATEEEVKRLAIENKSVKTWIEGKEIRRVIYVPGRVINIVV